MRIRNFCKFIELHAVENHLLKNTPLVIDGHILLYDSYQKSELPHLFGCEGDRYAEYLRNYLSKFQKANLECYFVFKGVPEVLGKEKTIQPCQNVLRPANKPTARQFPGIGNCTASHLFTRTIWKEVLQEMDFRFVICEYNSREDCIALAQKLKCPILSFDMNYCFSGVPYIPISTLHFDIYNQAFMCKLFTLDFFLQKYRICEEKLALFCTLNDELIFPHDHFFDFLRAMGFRYSAIDRFNNTLDWLSRVSYNQAQSCMLHYMNPADIDDFLEAERSVRQIIGKAETGGVPTEYFGKKIKYVKNDKRWFAKGVADQHIAIPYVNLYRSIVFGSRVTVSVENEDPVMMSMDIILYAYNLLTNYENDGLQLQRKREDFTRCIAKDMSSIKKPEYEAKVCVFENGWYNIKSLRLFEHFIVESLPKFDFEVLNTIPNDVALLMIALVYFSKKKSTVVTNEVYSVILSYVMLGVVFQKYDKNFIADTAIVEKESVKVQLVHTTKKPVVTAGDCNQASVPVTRDEAAMTAEDCNQEPVATSLTNETALTTENCNQASVPTITTEAIMKAGDSNQVSVPTSATDKVTTTTEGCFYVSASTTHKATITEGERLQASVQTSTTQEVAMTAGECNHATSSARIMEESAMTAGDCNQATVPTSATRDVAMRTGDFNRDIVPESTTQEATITTGDSNHEIVPASTMPEITITAADCNEASIPGSTMEKVAITAGDCHHDTVSAISTEEATMTTQDSNQETLLESTPCKFAITLGDCNQASISTSTTEEVVMTSGDCKHDTVSASTTEKVAMMAGDCNQDTVPTNATEEVAMTAGDCNDATTPASTTDKDTLTVQDCNIAAALLRKYFNVDGEVSHIYSRRRFYPLAEFQHCLEHMNYLNTLCGKPYSPTVYHKTYNGTFVYQILHQLNKGHGLEFVKKLLSTAPTVLAFILGLVQVFQHNHELVDNDI